MSNTGAVIKANADGTMNLHYDGSYSAGQDLKFSAADWTAIKALGNGTTLNTAPDIEIQQDLAVA